MNDENAIAYVCLSISDMLAVPVDKLPALVALLQDTIQIRREWKEPYKGKLVVVYDRGHTTLSCMTEAEMVMAKVIGKKLFEEQES